ncbi:hypothetical protein DQX05_16270 [Paenibacillus thiaminolyticus]|uniref:DUF7660 domain-containing protein n=1 Tax=Paenibacillus thiaminolyticus TaxID=49283 RepID=A0A3A3GI35_PANTH|nr:hypothetical protein DQX05_16270 [Paenibacillus thiaminolyticus]
MLLHPYTLYDQNKQITEEWENESIEAFLEAVYEGGLTSIDGLTYFNKPNNPWKRCAQILYMGKIYE